MIKLFLAAAIVLLAACSTPQKKILSSSENQAWLQASEQARNIHQWNITGRVSIATESNGGQADLFWNQTDDLHYEIKLVAPFGGGTSLLQSQAQGVFLSTSDGQQLAAQNLDELLSQIEDWNIPVQAIRYWLLGIPSPKSDSKLLGWNEKNQLTLLEQDGWHVKLKSYKNVGQYQLPKKLFMTRNDDENVDVRLVIRQWGINE